jgi:peroxiredoxin
MGRMFQSACVPYSAKARRYSVAKSSGSGGISFMTSPRFYHVADFIVDAGANYYHNVVHMKKPLIPIFLILACLLPLLVRAEADHRKAPDFSRMDVTGHKVRLSEYRGKVLLLDFWATWCTGCKEEMPWYVEFADKYRKNGLAVLGVAMDDEGWSVVRPFLQEKMKLNYPVVVGDDALAKQFGGIDAMPVTLLIDRQGNIAYSHVGVVDKAKFEEEIQELLSRAR